MKCPLLITLVVLSGCNWQEAENRARCTAGELSFCDGGTSGGGAGGGSAGGGGGTGGDNGRLDFIVPNGTLPFSLEEGPGGLVWVITSEPGWTYISQLKNGELTFIGPFDAGPTASHSDPSVSDVLVVATVNGGAGSGFPDGGVVAPITLPSFATVISQFVATDGGLNASFWLNGSNEYLQFLAPSPSLVGPQKVLPMSNCSGLAFHDFTTVDAGPNCCGIVSFSGACNGGIGTGIDGGAGIQIISTDNVRYGVQLEPQPTRVAVGRSFDGFDVATRASAPIVIKHFDRTIRPGMEYRINASAGVLSLGDVSDGFVTFHAAANFSVEDTSVTGIGSLTAVLAEPSTRRVEKLGLSESLTKIPVLALPGRVLVLWKRSDDKVVLTQFSR